MKFSGSPEVSFSTRLRIACNAPIKGLYEIGVEIEENSELDLLVSYKAHAGDPRIPAICEDMAKEMGEGAYYPDLNERMAQFELTLLDWAEQHKGSRKYHCFSESMKGAGNQYPLEVIFYNMIFRIFTYTIYLTFLTINSNM